MISKICKRIVRLEKTEKGSLIYLCGLKIRLRNNYSFSHLFIKFCKMLPIPNKMFLNIARRLDGKYDFDYQIKYHQYNPNDIFELLKTFKIYPKNIMSIEETVNYIIHNRISLSRLGDGEEFWENMAGARCMFPELREKLLKICAHGSDKNCLVCINNFNVDKEDVSLFFRKAYAYYYSNTLTAEKLEMIDFSKASDYGDAYAFLFYFKLGDSLEETERKKEEIAKIWENKKVLFVVNKESPIINDKKCFKNTKEKAYVFGPGKDAYSDYSRIISEIKSKYDNSWLVYIEMGALASVLAYELAEEGYQALDMGAYYARIHAQDNVLSSLE